MLSLRGFSPSQYFSAHVSFKYIIILVNHHLMPIDSCRLDTVKQSRHDALVEAALKQVDSVVVALQALLQTAQAAQSAGKGAGSHKSCAFGIASLELVCTLASQADLLSEGDGQENGQEEDSGDSHGFR
jgi:hypothetical protein